jgi:hypothetical protein
MVGGAPNTRMNPAVRLDAARASARVAPSGPRVTQNVTCVEFSEGGESHEDNDVQTTRWSL